MKKIKIYSVVFFLLGIILGVLAKLNLTLPIDMFIYDSLISLENDTLTAIFKSITFLGSTKFIVILNLIILAIWIFTKRKEVLIAPLNSVLSVVFNNVIKFLIKRDRPNVKRLVSESFYSYPSGHAMISTLFYGSIILIINKSNIRIKNIINVFILLIILLIGISRIYLGVHYASDIIGGYLIGTSILLFSKEKIYEGISNRS